MKLKKEIQVMWTILKQNYNIDEIMKMEETIK